MLVVLAVRAGLRLQDAARSLADCAAAFQLPIGQRRGTERADTDRRVRRAEAGTTRAPVRRGVGFVRARNEAFRVSNVERCHGCTFREVWVRANPAATKP